MDLDVEAQVPQKMLTALALFTDTEIRKLLGNVAKRAGPLVFVRHFELLQGDPVQNHPRYLRWKQKKYGTTRKFEKTGAALKGLQGNTAPLHTELSVKRRTIRFSLRKMDGGTNVYNVAQKGHFKGLEVTKKGFLGRKKVTKQTAAQVHQQQIRRGMAFRLAQAKGYKGTFTQFHAEQRGGKPKDETKRLSGAAYPILAPREGDREIIEPIIIDEIQKLLKARGLD